MSLFPSSRGSRILLLLLLMMVLLGVGYAVYYCWSRPDMELAFRANLRGVGWMEQYDYPKALKEFEDVVRVAPEWEPGRINLGLVKINIAHNPDSNDSEERVRLYRQAIEQFQWVLTNKPQSEYLAYAHYGLGLCCYEGLESYEEAVRQFTRVTELDAGDAGAWLMLGLAQIAQEKHEEAGESFKAANRLDPNLSGAIYNYQQKLREAGQDELATRLMNRLEALNKGVWVNHFDPKYNTDYGKYGFVIGGRAGKSPVVAAGPAPTFKSLDSFAVDLKPGTTWLTPDGIGTNQAARIFRVIRARFGATMVALDYNGDGKTDLLLTAAVIEKGEIRSLLLRNEGDGRFTDVTHEAGLAAATTVLGCTVADFDNDGSPDVFLTTITGGRLYRNTARGGFEDVTKTAGLENISALMCLSATFVDLDQDGDLDLLVNCYNQSVDEIFRAIEGENVAPGRVNVFLNVGEAKPASPTVDPPALTPAFRRDDTVMDKLGKGRMAVAAVISDVDQDQDLDLILLHDGYRPDVVLNDRLLEFTRIDDFPFKALDVARWNGALVLDVNNDERSDLLMLRDGKKPWLCLRRATPPGGEHWMKWYDSVELDVPAMRQARVVDLDLDGRADVVGLTADGKAVWLQSDGKTLVARPTTFDAIGEKLEAVLPTDLDGDGVPDLLGWTESSGLKLLTNQGNGFRPLRLVLSGHRRISAGGFPERTNADGFGVRVSAQSGAFWATQENTTLSAGLGQSSVPLTLGMGARVDAELVQVRWPDIVWQAEFNVQTISPGDRSFGVKRIEETNRKQTSCPLLFTWDGRRFVFVTDFLGEGSMGERLAGGGHRLPRPEESVKIEPHQLAPKDGEYVLKFAEPMSEATYLDRLQLVVLDHRNDVRVYPDERFAAGGPPPTQELLAFRDPVPPVTARDHRGQDVTAVLKAWDRDMVSGFARRKWIGFAEEHAVELDFGDRLARFGPQDRVVLFLAGWTDYAYPESIWAAGQAGVEPLAPVLERRSADGRWEKVVDAGFPAGLPRMMTVDLTGKVGGPSCVLRLRTNLHVHWDQIFAAPLVAPSAFTPHVREVKAAALAARGCLKEFSPDGKEPTVYDYDRLDAFPVTPLAGRLTRFGDVTELMTRADDRFVIFGPGDDLTVTFDAKSLPALPEGWTRSFVLRTWGYCKDCAPFTASGDTIGPLPFRAMKDYPYGSGEKHPDPEYDRVWNTRRVGK